MRRVELRRPAEPSRERAGIAVVIDVLRMTSTAAILMSRPSCAGLAVAATLADLDRLTRPLSEYVVVSELAHASPPATAWIDNSPAQASRIDVQARTPVLVTTNGTRTLLAATAHADRVLLASFRDLRAVANHIAAAALAVVLMPAGHFESGERRIEDDLCADALAELLAGREPDLVASAAAVRADARVRRRVEAAPGFSSDLELALETDPRAAVLEFRTLGAGIGHISRA